MRVEGDPGPARELHVMRRSGEVVCVREGEVVKLKLIPSGSGPLRRPAAWDDDG